MAESGLVLFLCKIFVHLFVLTALGPHCHAGPSPAAEGGPSLAGAQAPHCGGASRCRVWASVTVAHKLSSFGSWALENRLNYYGTRAQLLLGM